MTDSQFKSKVRKLALVTLTAFVFVVVAVAVVSVWQLVIRY
jgi:hypothetical protein